MNNGLGGGTCRGIGDWVIGSIFVILLLVFIIMTWWYVKKISKDTAQIVTNTTPAKPAGG